MSEKLIFVLGGARGGKSSYAQSLALERGGADVLYVATAEALDEEMRTRIAAHKAERPSGWRTLEVPSLRGADLAQEMRDSRVILVDCLTLLASNVLMRVSGSRMDQYEAELEAEIKYLLETCARSVATWVVVSNEVGLGLVPENPLSRAYRDALGRANQQVAAQADQVLFMIAGIPMRVK